MRGSRMLACRSRVLYVAEDRKQESVDGFWGTLTPEHRVGIEAIAMDMWAPAIQSTQAHLDGAEATIVFDKFHLATHLHEAVDGVRRADQRALKQADDSRLREPSTSGSCGPRP
jgi:transposase